MDPLSIAASITALLQLTGTIIQYLNSVKGAPEDRQRLLLELCNVSSILYILEDQASLAQQGDAWSSTLLSINGPNGPIKQFKTALERLEKKLRPVDGLRHIVKIIAWPFQKEEITEILDVIERQKTLFNLARQNDHIRLSKAIKDDIVSLRGEVGTVGQRLTELHIDENICRWLASPDASLNHNKARKDRHPGTGTWFVESKVFTDWKTTPASFLWLYGIPGCGKTILSSTIVEDVINHCDFKPALAVLYFYFDFKDVKKQGQESMIRSLILQLYSQSKVTHQSLEALHSSCMNGGRQPTPSMLLATLHQMMESFEETFIILDALDECSEREELLDNIKEFYHWTNVNLHILSTSRREKDIEEQIEPLAHSEGKICIDSMHVNDDIRAFVHENLQTDVKLKRWGKEPKAQQEIENALMDKADGMFRWAACQLDSLRSCLNLYGLRKTLASLPKDLDETYDRILESIDEDYEQDALKILQWLTYSARPLRLEEIAEVVAIDVKESPRFNPDKRYPEPQDIWTICSSLISLQEEVLKNAGIGNPRIIVQLAHFTVKEYLVSSRIQKGRVRQYSVQEVDANAFIAESSLAYLLQFDKPDSLTTQSVDEYPLADYAARYWTEHARLAEKDSTLAPLLSMELLLTKGHALLNWIRLYNPEKSWEGSKMTRGLDDIRPPLYYASMTGLIRSVKSILDKGADINARGGDFGNALQAASKAGHEKVVQILLDNGADVNTQGGNYGNALQAASIGGYEKVVQILLNNGADINAQGGYYSNALQAASIGGYEKVVQILLNNGADINAQGRYYGNALQAASRGGHEKVVQILLNNGADINAQGGDYGNALQAASIGGYKKVVQILLDNRADINAQGGDFGNALQAASIGGYKKVVQILLDNRADINAQGGYYSNALQAASRGGHEKVVQILLDNGADVNAQGGEYGNALQAASSGGHEKVVQILLDNGADVNAQGGYFGNALQAASRGGHEKVVQILLDNGADINAQDGDYGNALQAASRGGHEKVVQILLDNGADINAQGGDFGNALQAASRGGHEKVVQILLDNGADVNAQGGCYSNALRAALYGNHHPVVQMLLDKGADVNDWNEINMERLYTGVRDGRYYLQGADVQN